MRAMKFEAVLFDCDGVLVDSEPITNGVLRDMLEELGWTLTPAECMRIFLGRTIRSEAALIEAKTGRPLTEEWLAVFRERRDILHHRSGDQLADRIFRTRALSPGQRRDRPETGVLQSAGFHRPVRKFCAHAAVIDGQAGFQHQIAAELE